MFKKTFGFLAAAAVLSTFPVQAKEIHFCTGGKSGNYFAAGNDIAQQLQSKLKVHVTETTGSIDNFGRLTKKECQYAIVQADTLLEWASRGNPETDIEEVDSLYKEYFHMIVNSREAPTVEQKFSNVNNAVKVMRDRPDSGTAATWGVLVRADKAENKDKSRLAAVPTVPEGGLTVVGKLRSGKDAQAVLFMSGIGSGVMKRVDTQALDDNNKKVLCLVDMDDGGTFSKATWERVVNASGKKVYEKAVIDRNSGYRNLLCNKSSINTFATNAIVVVDRKWKEANPELAETMAEAIMAARPVMLHRMKEAAKK